MDKQDMQLVNLHLHFASNLDAFKRLKKLGEQEFRIFNYGAPQLDDLYNEKYINFNKKTLKKNITLKKIKITFCVYIIL